MILIGQYLGESQKDFSYADKTSGELLTGTEENLHVLDGLYTRVVTRLRDFDNSRLPQVGQTIALDVWGQGIGRQVAFKANRVLDSDEVLEELGLLPRGVSAAS